jgi:hypothetical protein
MRNTGAVPRDPLPASSHWRMLRTRRTLLRKNPMGLNSMAKFNSLTSVEDQGFQFEDNIAEEEQLE